MKLPPTRYYGSKRRVVEKIWNKLNEEHIEFESFLDLFGGTGIVSYFMLAKGKKVSYNDIFKFNCENAKALLEAPKGTVTPDDALKMLVQDDGYQYKDVIAENYKGIYFKDEENIQIDIAIQNINRLSEYKKACGFYILNQSCLIKRPFNLFHRNNLSLRLNHTNSKFGNYVTWEKNFSELFVHFAKELNEFQFLEKMPIKIFNEDALKCKANADLIYIDTPYFNNTSPISYHSRYHFLEGLQYYDDIVNHINEKKRNKEIEINVNLDFEKKESYVSQLKKLLDHYRYQTIVISYTTKGYPSIEVLMSTLAQFKNRVSVVSLGKQSFALNRNNKDREEVLIIGR